MIKQIACAICLIAILACNAKPKLDVEFTAKDLTPPQVLSITPANGATEVLDKPTIVIAFNEDIDSGTLNSSTVTVKTANGTAGIGSYEYDAVAKALSIRIVQSLYLNTGYTITVTSAVKDRAGNAIAPVTSAFSTDVCPKVRKGKPGFNDTIYAIVKSGCTLFAGGQFTSIGEAFSNGVSLDALTGKAAAGYTYEDINGAVRAAVSDGNGGWYVGGNFTQIGPYTRNRLAHILANGEIAPWNPNADATVFALAVIGSTVYAGGNFTTINGTARIRLAAIGTDGTLQAWSPDASSTVRALTVSGSTIYAGGDFTTIGGTPRNYLAAIGTDGTLLAWNPNANNFVFALAVGGSTVYAGGQFTTIGGTARNRLAAIGTDGTLQAWNPNATASVLALAVSGSTIYAGGSFSCFGNCPAGTEGVDKWTRSRLAAIGTDGTLQAWNPVANNSVRALAVSGSTIYAGGDFTNIGCTSGCSITGGPYTRNRLAAIGTDGTLQSWNPNASSPVYALAVSGSTVSTVYAGGDFTTIGGTPRNYLAAIGTDGTLQSWNPNANNWVYALAVSGSTVFVGGQFTTIGGTARNRLAAIGTDGTLQSWNPNANNWVFALAVSGSTVYAGGSFFSIGGTARDYLAAITADSTCLTAYTGACLQGWNPNADATVFALAVSDDFTTVYAGGDFTTIGGSPRNYLAAIGTDGNLQPWNPDASGTVNAIAVSGSTVFAGGDFTTMGGTPRNYLAAIANDGTLQAWIPNANNLVYALAVSGSTVFAGGDFTTMGGTPRNYLAAIANDGTLQAWNPNASGTVSALAVSGSTVFAGGSFTTIGGNPHSRLASINTDGSVNW